MKCVRCNSTDNLTKDHIIPKWAYKRTRELGINFKKNVGKKNIQTMCSKCNNKKSGDIDCSTKISRDFWTKVRDKINKKLK